MHARAVVAGRDDLGALGAKRQSGDRAGVTCNAVLWLTAVVEHVQGPAGRGGQPAPVIGERKALAPFRSLEDAFRLERTGIPQQNSAILSGRGELPARLL